jgi:hypothetical protein
MGLSSQKIEIFSQPLKDETLNMPVTRTLPVIFTIVISEAE